MVVLRGAGRSLGLGSLLFGRLRLRLRLRERERERERSTRETNSHSTAAALRLPGGGSLTMKVSLSPRRKPLFFAS